jgi:hypothetical protein
MLLWIVAIVSILLNLALLYGAWNLIKKNEVAEDFIVKSYEAAKRTLLDARELDNKKMFELDDEVGMLFQELIAIIRFYAEFMGVEEPMEYDEEKETQ